MSRLAYDLENLLSPVIAGLALLFITYTGLFIANSVAFLISAALIVSTVLPPIQEVYRQGSAWDEISFGIRSYLKTPRLRGLLALYMGVASASAMIIVNTVIYIREYLGGSASDVAIALAAAGCGSMIVADQPAEGTRPHSGSTGDVTGGRVHGGGAWTYIHQAVIFRRVAHLVSDRSGLVIGADTGGPSGKQVFVTCGSVRIFFRPVRSVPCLLADFLSGRGSVWNPLRRGNHSAGSRCEHPGVCCRVVAEA